MEDFLSCDWGTSTFRLRLVAVDSLNIVAEEVSGEGIASTFAAWQDHTDQNRQTFYLAVIKKYIAKIESKLQRSLKSVQVIISGMASSTIGFIDVPYSDIPLAVSGENIKTASIAPAPDFEHDVLVISGVKTDDDVMRGEETQLIGCIEPNRGVITDELFIFPGTHSKHIRVVNNLVTGFKTYMTGEFFDLLSTKSILRTSVEKSAGGETHVDAASFKEGVWAAINGNLLNAAFSVRTNNLFDKLTKEENFSYLSGLLIATELKDIDRTLTKITLVCGPGLGAHYLLALDELGFSSISSIYETGQAYDIVVRGHYKILNNHK